ncbi:hypothetical protein ACQPYK_50295 (plasmid) [Streptosporangium sp. CA-135522]|uniref:hypothetical protein n=1 Tax=Streptosporangium sp. CA-135522 TaxID=3240072 RepID=UPI003D9407D1
MTCRVHHPLAEGALAAERAAHTAAQDCLAELRGWLAGLFPVDPEAPAAERARVRARARAHLQGLRQHGELCDSVDVLMTHAVRAELGKRDGTDPTIFA